MTFASETALTQLDDLRVLLARDPDPALEASLLADEHIRGARTYLVGEMYTEYGLNLELARKAVAGIPDDRVRSEADRILANLIEQK